MKKKLIILFALLSLIAIAGWMAVLQIPRQEGLTAEIVISDFDVSYGMVLIVRLYSDRTMECVFGQQDGSNADEVVLKDVKKQANVQLSAFDYFKVSKYIEALKDEKTVTGVMTSPGLRAVTIECGGIKLQRSFNIIADLLSEDLNSFYSWATKEEVKTAFANDALIKGFAEYLVKLSTMKIDLMGKDGLRLK